MLKPTASQASFKTDSDDFGIAVPEAGLPKRQMNPVVAGLAAALAAAGAGALGFWLYWRRKGEGENAAHAAAGAHASGDTASCEDDAAAWSVAQAIENWRPTQVPNLSESTTEPLKPIE